MLLFIHVPKTAGQYLKRALHAVYAPGRLVEDYDDYPELPQSRCHTDPLGWRRDAAAFARQLPPAAQVIFGHFTAAKYLTLLPDARWLTWVRHSVRRLVSNYFHLKSPSHADATNHVLLQAVRGGASLAEFAEIPVMLNLATRLFLHPLRPEDFAFIGVQEHFDEDLEDLWRLLRWPRVPLAGEPTNVNGYPGYAGQVRSVLSDAGLVRHLERLNRDDLDFYRRAVELRRKRRSGTPTGSTL